MIFITNVALVAALKNYGIEYESTKMEAKGKVVFIYPYSKKLFRLQQRFAKGKLKISDARWFSLEMSKMRTVVRGVAERGTTSHVTAAPTNNQVIVDMPQSKKPKEIGSWNPFKNLTK